MTGYNKTDKVIREMPKKISSKRNKSKGKVLQENEATSRVPMESVDHSVLSLAMRLKRERGTAATTPLPPEWSRSSVHQAKYLTPEDGDDFNSCVKECYRGFVYEKPNDIPPYIHDAFASVFRGLDDSGLFLYDVVQPGGKKLSLTFVTRTLVGDPGSTYKYLGLRLFSHPWCDVDDNGDGKVMEGDASNLGKTLVEMGYSRKCARALIQTGLVNKQLIERTNRILQTEISPFVKNGLVGSADYSLTLINKMEPSKVKKDLKNETIHGLGKTSVSWHKDSGLQDFSSIAVYHSLHEVKSKTRNDVEDKVVPWKVALRVSDTNTKSPAVSIPLPSGSLYYLLDDFNHRHEHAVISGSDSLRYSSTHRVARDGAGTWQYIREKCKTVLSSSLCVEVLNANNEHREPSLSNYEIGFQRKMLVKEVRNCHCLMTEIEFEWIQQWYIQGETHSKLHPYWLKPIKYLEKVWLQLEKVISYIYSILKLSSTSRSISAVCEDLFDVTIEALEERKKLRNSWKLRLKDSIFRTLKSNERPFICDALKSAVINNDIESSIVREWRSAFVLLEVAPGNSSNSKKRKTKDKTSSLTKREKKRVASNWEKLKKKL